ncbi:uncharacterized protein LOC132474785 [Gadus macrocephalus]|uniref:uncharacterized protein LOC132474785 n=1 Tax=Gadus macrocephalus TaxID=80720 RepID=UPI0028CBA060|nr:uncharacterized protein LOC132474785 [Gadus macrocephalus]
MSGNSRQHWPLGETQALLNIWADDSVQKQMEGMCRNEEVIQYIVNELSKMGIQRTTIQIREKLKKLRQQYKAVKRDETKTFPFFEMMDSVLGDKVGLHLLDADHTADKSTSTGSGVSATASMKGTRLLSKMKTSVKPGFRKRRSEADGPTQGFVGVMAECHRRWLEKEEELRREEMQQEAQLRREEMEQELVLRREEGEREERLRHDEMEARSKDTELLTSCLAQVMKHMAKEPSAGH